MIRRHRITQKQQHMSFFNGMQDGELLKTKEFLISEYFYAKNRPADADNEDGLRH